LLPLIRPSVADRQLSRLVRGSSGPPRPGWVRPGTPGFRPWMPEAAGVAVSPSRVLRRPVRTGRGALRRPAPCATPGWPRRGPLHGSAPASRTVRSIAGLVLRSAERRAHAQRNRSSPARQGRVSIRATSRAAVSRRRSGQRRSRTRGLRQAADAQCRARSSWAAPRPSSWASSETTRAAPRPRRAGGPGAGRAGASACAPGRTGRAEVVLGPAVGAQHPYRQQRPAVAEQAAVGELAVGVGRGAAAGPQRGRRGADQEQLAGGTAGARRRRGQQPAGTAGSPPPRRAGRSGRRAPAPR
jgi:hypothetical protein